MNAKTLRRLASDHADLHKAGLPPNYLFPPKHSSDDLTNLDVLLAGPLGTPYSDGVWKLHLSIPIEFPKTPPKASFRTEMWHPNVDAATGAICVETLKRDWDPQLTLRHILVTISCLLIYPNPDSALNAEASALQQDDYEMFARRAKTMTSVHALIPGHLARVVAEAQRRGEEADLRKPPAMSSTSSQSSTRRDGAELLRAGKKPAMAEAASGPIAKEVYEDSSDSQGVDDNESDSSKENESITSVTIAPPAVLSPTKSSVLGKRPLADLSVHFTTDVENGQASSNNQAASGTTTGTTSSAISEHDQEMGAPPRKSPKTGRYTQAHSARDGSSTTPVVAALNTNSAQGEHEKVQYKNGKPVIVNAPVGGIANAKITHTPKNSVWPRRGIYRL